MKIAATIFFALLTLIAAKSAKAEDKYQACLDTGFDMKGCTATENERLDPILKAAYQAAMAREPHNRDLLANTQKAWEKSSSSTCDYAFSLGEGGTISGLMSGGCLVDQTKRRIFELSENGMRELGTLNPAVCSGDSTSPDALANCIAKEFAQVDKYLNSSYRNILMAAAKEDESIGKNNAGARPSLIRAEKAWIAFRDAQCGYLSARQQGAEIRLADLRCRTAMTVQRTKELEGLQ